jgi:hypothetical protein
MLLLPELHSHTYNAIMLPLVFMGITAYVLCQNKPRELFAAVFVSGILYSFCIHYGSNQSIYVISMAFAAVNVASLLFLGQLLREMRETPDSFTYPVAMKRICLVSVVAMLVMQGAFQIGSKARHVFWEGSIDTLQTEITEGPAAGLLTTPQKAQEYNEIYRDLSAYWSMEEDNLLILTERTWTYLAAEMPYGTYSAWLSGEKPSTIDRLRSFYQLNPDKTPRYIYVPSKSKWDMKWLLAELKRMDYTGQRKNAGYAFEKH